MIGAILGLVAGSAAGRRLVHYGAVALAVALFLLSIRRSGERVGRMTEKLEQQEKAHVIQRRMLEAAARRPRNRDELVERLRDGGF
ncbi:hypothetical protein FAP39_16725 [Shimia litoralis]|uniref:Uncharacterized protein n=1 Tax=Shimia litoralis TaxID=420403 RepID=A0A4U7MST0_9RHOB|nr:hypothetical protein [Shimia litoralis]TKZ15858.1 hypothetical protein FAP39_16725 [Shimia litoralis]